MAYSINSKTFSELYEIISHLLSEEKIKRFMEGSINMSKDEFVLHEWNKELFDDLVKYNELEDAKKEGKTIGKNIGIEQRNTEIVKNMLKKKMSLKDISEITGLTIKDIQKLNDENDK